MWGIVPAAGLGSRIQPLAFSKELLPLGSTKDGDAARPRAVSEYLVDRLVAGGADHVCFVISPGKSDIVEYFGAGLARAHVSYVVQPRAAGLCDAIFRALPLIRPDEQVLVGLPDTVWFPEDALRALPGGGLSFLLFPVEQPDLFDAVITDHAGRVVEIQVKEQGPVDRWIWGAFKLDGAVMRELYDLWCERSCRDSYLGTLVNAWLARGGEAMAVRGGDSYVDVGTLNGYREAIHLLDAAG